MRTVRSAAVPFTGRRRLALCFAAAVLSLAPVADVSRSAQAEDLGSALEMKSPLVVVNLAGVERLLGDVQYMFTAIERPEIFEAVQDQIGNAGDLRGLDRTKPFGVMLYVELGFPPRPEPVGYIPASDVEQLVRSAGRSGIRIRKVAGQDDRYEIGTPLEYRREGGPPLHVRVQNDYAFIARTPEVLDREFPDPVTLTNALTSRYDVAVRAGLDSVPEGMKTIFLDYLRAETEAQLQQRDGEPQAAYELRRLSGLNNLEFIEGLLTDGKDVTFGIDASAENQRIALEFGVEAEPDSKFAKQLTDLGGKRSYFTAAVDEQVPLAASASWASGKSEQERNAKALDTLEQAVSQRLEEQSIGGEKGEKGGGTKGTQLFVPDDKA